MFGYICGSSIEHSPALKCRAKQNKVPLGLRRVQTFRECFSPCSVPEALCLGSLGLQPQETLRLSPVFGVFLLDDAFADATEEVDVFDVEIFGQEEIDAGFFEGLAEAEDKRALALVEVIAELGEGKLNILAGDGAKFEIAHRLFGQAKQDGHTNRVA